MGYWCCGQTEPRREAAAQHFLQLGGFEVYCPRLRLVRPRRGRKVVSHPPLFPSYLFIRIISGWWAARWSIGMVRLLTAGDTPMPVPDSLIFEIKSRERGGLVELPRREKFKAGDRVRILQGSFAGQCVRMSGCWCYCRCLAVRNESSYLRATLSLYVPDFPRRRAGAAVILGR